MRYRMTLTTLLFISFLIQQMPAIRIPYGKDTHNTPAYFYPNGNSTHLRFLNYRMTISNCRCSYTKLQAPLQPLIPSPKAPRPLYMRLNLLTSLTYCLNFRGCTDDVLSVITKSGAAIIRSPDTFDLGFGNSSFTINPLTFKIREAREQGREMSRERGRASFIPSLRKINRDIKEVFKQLGVPGRQAQQLYWAGLMKFYQGYHWVPRSKVILKLDFNHSCVLRSKIRYPTLLHKPGQSGPKLCFRRAMQPLPFRGGNITVSDYKVSYVYKVGNMYLANLDSSWGHPKYPPYMNRFKPYNCPYVLAPINMGVTTCRVKVLKHYLQWRTQKEFYLRYPTYLHFLRACQQYGDEPYLGHKIREGSFDGTLPTSEFKPDKDAINYAARREGHQGL
jgi:hypothetical protein